ncbi:uncharacterized protein PHACADRAFT_264664 [Phanerochaete carnosa HHB-10118-sp]|uniref:Uncharacterized protein n=1 Tax=Phanerochaete carnosa (strain HHB-10118-sp) TaxID=650164 RepID=K5VU55_PHACS|nr:uncharacterized protein PHACADRAFT_264664 [Phanerochaete carnosa HHB-10118-sp]EKM50114.1 hypothetical protein PHACADRAFT_264664 [Phanerochaete carnosa HHB-10118-sp]
MVRRVRCLCDDGLDVRQTFRSLSSGTIPGPPQSASRNKLATTHFLGTAALIAAKRHHVSFQRPVQCATRRPHHRKHPFPVIPP